MSAASDYEEFLKQQQGNITYANPYGGGGMGGGFDFSGGDTGTMNPGAAPYGGGPPGGALPDSADTIARRRDPGTPIVYPPGGAGAGDVGPADDFGPGGASAGGDFGSADGGGDYTFQDPTGPNNYGPAGGWGGEEPPVGSGGNKPTPGVDPPTQYPGMGPPNKPPMGFGSTPYNPPGSTIPELPVLPPGGYGGGKIGGLGPPIYPGGGGGAAGGGFSPGGGGAAGGGGGTADRGGGYLPNPIDGGIGVAGPAPFSPPTFNDPTAPGGGAGGGTGTPGGWSPTPGTGTAAPGAGTGSPGTTAGNPLGDLAGSFQSQTDAANAANQQRLNSGMQGYLDRMNTVLTGIGQQTNQDYLDAQNRLQQDKAHSDQDLVNRGLGNTTARPNAQRGLISDYNANLNKIRDSRLATQVNAQSGLSKDTLDFMERATQQGPDMSFLAQLAQMIGTNGPLGGAAAGGQSAPSSPSGQTVNTPQGPVQIPSNPQPGSTINIPGIGDVRVSSPQNLQRPMPGGGNAPAPTPVAPPASSGVSPSTPTPTSGPAGDYSGLLNSVLNGGSSRPAPALPAAGSAQGSAGPGVGVSQQQVLRQAMQRIQQLQQTDPANAAAMLASYQRAGLIPSAGSASPMPVGAGALMPGGGHAPAPTPVAPPPGAPAAAYAAALSNGALQPRMPLAQDAPLQRAADGSYISPFDTGAGYKTGGYGSLDDGGEHGGGPEMTLDANGNPIAKWLLELQQEQGLATIKR